MIVIQFAVKFLRRLQRRQTAPFRPSCPCCLSGLTAATMPTSPEVLTYRCADCHHDWAVPVRLLMHSLRGMRSRSSLRG
jgi:hypothetical protein